MQLVFQISNNNQKMFTETQHRVHECSEKAMPLVNLLCSNSEFNRVVCRMHGHVSQRELEQTCLEGWEGFCT